MTAPPEPPIHVQRIAAFSHGATGGNPVGVVLCDALPPAGQMLAVAAEVGYTPFGAAYRHACVISPI